MIAIMACIDKRYNKVRKKGTDVPLIIYEKLVSSKINQRKAIDTHIR